MNLFQTGQFRLNSGQVVPYKIECDALTDDDIETLCFLLFQRLPAFGRVEGVPRGGLRIERAMVKYASTGPLLIVDDVFTTGGSMERHRAGRDAIGGVLFARQQTPSWITPVFQLTPPV